MCSFSVYLQIQVVSMHFNSNMLLDFWDQMPCRVTFLSILGVITVIGGSFSASPSQGNPHSVIHRKKRKAKESLHFMWDAGGNNSDKEWGSRLST